MPILSLKESDIHYKSDDFNKKETVVFSNSLGCDLNMWDENIETLKNHFNVLRYDTRGHGKSCIQKDEVSIKELAGDVIELLNYLNLEKVIFCGLSMGGLIGQYLGLHFPARFSKIILSNTAAKIGTVEGWNNRIHQVKEHGLSSILDGTAERWFTAEYRAKYPDKVNQILGIFASNSLRGYTACCAAVRDADFREDLQNIDIPTLIITGTKDGVTTVEDGDFMQNKIPFSKQVSLIAAHLSNKEHPVEFSKKIIHFSGQQHIK